MHVGEVISEEYELEYGRDCLEMHVGAVQPGEHVLVVDDLIATGGTICAAISLLGLFFKEEMISYSSNKNNNKFCFWRFLNTSILFCSYFYYRESRG